LGTQNGYEKLITGINDLQISILINNAGMGYLGEFAEQNSDKITQLMNLNCHSPTLLTLKLLNGMKKARKGIIIFVSSLSQYQPLPYHAVYAASKSYISSFSLAIADELRYSGVEVLTIEPGTIDTEFQQVSGSKTHNGIQPVNVVKSTLNVIGSRCLYYSPGSTFYWLRSVIASQLPRSFVLPLARKRQLKLLTNQVKIET